MRSVFLLGFLSIFRCCRSDPFIDFKFREQPLDQVIYPTKSLKLQCTYNTKNNTKTVVEWYKDGVLFSKDSEVENLLIEKPVQSDEGYYQCQVKIYEKEKVKWVYLSRKAMVQFSRIRHFVHQPKSQKIFLNQSVTFKCSVVAIGNMDEINVEWFHNNHRVIPGMGGVVILPEGNTLELSHVNKNSSGTYKCIVRLNGQSLTSQTAILDVIEGVVPLPPVLSLKPSDKDVFADGSVLLECMANGSPQPKISWFRGSEPLKVDSHRLRYVGADRSNVLISKVRYSDAGNYLCVAENGHGKAESAATIQVVSHPKILKRPVNVVKTETEDIDFECTATGVPAPKITWFKSGEIIVPSEYFVIEPGRLRISGLIRDDEGVYQCFADNEYGSDQSSAQLIVKQAALTQALISGENTGPQSPTNVQVQSVGGRSLRLRWASPIGISFPDEVEYVVFYRKLSEVASQTYNTTSPSATLLSLDPDTEYKIRVSAVENHVIGKKSEEISVRTKKEEIVVGPVRNLSSKVLSSGSAKVTWDPPIDAPLNIKYKLFYKRTDVATELETQTVVVKPTYTLHGLDKNANYGVRVQSVGPDDQGNSSELLTFRTFSDIPDGPPLNVKAESQGPTSIIVRWSPPLENQRNGDITGYKIRYKTKGTKAVNLNVNGNMNEFKIEGLEPGTTYQVRVAAQTQNGTGMYSEWVSSLTLEDDEVETIPGAPAELLCYATANSIHLTWSPPQGNGVVIRGYVIGWGLFIPDVEKVTVDGSVHQYTITNVTAGRDYVISVRATNSAGTGFPIYETASTLERSEQPPKGTAGNSIKSSVTLAAPVGVQAEALSDGAVRVSWTDTTNAFNQVFVVRYSSNEDPSQFYYKNSTDTETIIENLQPNTQYEFAVSRKGDSQWSMSTLCKTGSSAPSSAPRDLTVVPNSPTARHDPNTVSLNWQPPKYANGEIDEYIVLYSDRLDVPDRDWIVDTVKGDRLSMQISSLSPNTAYHFKIQARNIKGYGPLSPVVTYTPGKVGYNTPGGVNNVNMHSSNGFGSFFTDFERYLPFIILGSVCVLFTILVVLCIFFCTTKCKGEKKDDSRIGYVTNSRTPTNRKASRSTPQKDCWITHPSNRVELFDVPNSSVNELKRLTNHSESPIPHYQHLQANGTVPRNYHQSSVSLESRQRTPQILYTGSNRQQITRIEVGSDKGSSFGGSNTGLQGNDTPPTASEGMYQTVRTNSNPLRSFVNSVNPVPPPLNLYTSPGLSHEPRLASVRPVVVASSTNLNRPMNKISNTVLPIGRAQAQPRVNLSNYSPNYSLHGSREDCTSAQDEDLIQIKTRSNQMSSPQSVTQEDVNSSQIENIITQLQSMQHDFDS